MIFARRHNARREEDGLAADAGASPGVRYGGWPGWRRVRGNGGAGSGPRRCAVALEAAGQAAPPLMARLPATPAAYGVALSRPFNASLRADCAHCTSLARAVRPGAPKARP